jgi:hypothetical protein
MDHWKMKGKERRKEEISKKYERKESETMGKRDEETKDIKRQK